MPYIGVSQSPISGFDPFMKEGKTLMLRPNFASLNCICKIVHMIANTMCIQVDYTLFFQDKLSFPMLVAGNGYLLFCLFYYQRKIGPKFEYIYSCS